MARRLYGHGSSGAFGRSRAGAAAFLVFSAVLTLCTAGVSPSIAQGYNEPFHYRATPVRPGGGLLGFLFGGSGSDRRDSDESDPGSGYRTMCVRLCDGYYWPVSFSTGRGGLMRDAGRCESSCESPARLFYHSSSGDPAGMVDLEGKPYSALEHAFRYRSEYVADCRCKPEPWSDEAKLEYARRAEAAEQEVAEESSGAAAPETASRAHIVPVSARRPRRVLEDFNPFGGWFN